MTTVVFCPRCHWYMSDESNPGVMVWPPIGGQCLNCRATVGRRIAFETVHLSGVSFEAWQRKYGPGA